MSKHATKRAPKNPRTARAKSPVLKNVPATPAPTALALFATTHSELGLAMEWLSLLEYSLIGYVDEPDVHQFRLPIGAIVERIEGTRTALDGLVAAFNRQAVKS